VKKELIKWICILASALIPLNAVAQLPSAEPSVPNQPRTVYLPFLVTDSHGAPVEGITAEDLSIFDNKQPPQSIISVGSGRQLPLRIGMLIDASRSQQRAALYRPTAQAALDFLKQAMTGPDDKAFIARFSTVTEATTWMTRDQMLQWRVNLNPDGGTALYDSIMFACRQRMQADSTLPARRVLIIVSDGDDNQSRVTRAEAIAAAQASGTMLFTITTNEAPEDRGDATLKRFASETGGLAYLEGRHDVAKVFSSLLAQIENMYYAGYVPASSGGAGKFHSVALKPKSGVKWKVHAPAAYALFTPTPSQP
jgi:VWFA-related protein